MNFSNLAISIYEKFEHMKSLNIKMNNQSGFLHVNTAQDKTLEINFRLILRTKIRKKKPERVFGL